MTIATSWEHVNGPHGLGDFTASELQAAYGTTDPQAIHDRDHAAGDDLAHKHHRSDCDDRCNGDWCECPCHQEVTPSETP